MKEHDREIVEDARKFKMLKPWSATIKDLITIIDRLDKENEKLKADLDKHFRRLAKALKEER